LPIYATDKNLAADVDWGFIADDTTEVKPIDLGASVLHADRNAHQYRLTAEILKLRYLKHE